MASSKKSIVAAVVADVAIAAVKFAGGALTGSAVMVAEGVHSLVDGGNASLMLLAQRLAARPADEEHPMPRREWINFIVLGAALAFDGTALVIALRELRRYQREKGYRGGVLDVVRQSHNPPIFLTVLLDAAACCGVLVAMAGIGVGMALHSPVPDAVASMVDGLIMMSVAVVLAWEARGLIVGEPARSRLLDDAEALIRSDARVRELSTLRLVADGAASLFDFDFAFEFE